ILLWEYIHICSFNMQVCVSGHIQAHICTLLFLPVCESICVLCVTVVCIPLMLFGLLGNMLTILVVLLRPHMRSSTYLYLSSMAVSDLLILLLLPLDLYKLWRPRPWPFGDLACKLTMFLSECCTFSTILHITFLSLERYLAVCWPITAKTLVTRRRTKTVIGCLWLGQKHFFYLQENCICKY
uniref:Growth hormone secretagogue receptor type 1 n=1 Tax=Myripristis murdjan TaxID=586833 RepID=A0A667WU97_9TELE